MFKQYPYKGWLIIAVIFWGLAASAFYVNNHKARPEELALAVSEDIQHREKALNKLLANPEIIKNMFLGKLSSENIDELAQQPFYIYAFEEDFNLIYWNNNSVIGTCFAGKFQNDDKSLYKNNGVFYKRCLRLPYLNETRSIVILFPVSFQYPIQNEYLKSGFIASRHIPVNTKITSIKTFKTLAVKNITGEEIFYLQFSEHELPGYIFDWKLILPLLIAVFFSVLWFHLIAIYLSEKRSNTLGLGIIIAVVAVVLSFIYLSDISVSSSELSIFSINLYASSKIFPSLGVLIIVTLCTLWIIIFSVSRFKKLLVPKSEKVKFRTGIAVIVLFALLIGCATIPVYLLRSLVLDSKIQFDVSDFNSINFFSLIGLLTIGLISCCTALIIYFCNLHLNFLLKSLIIKYALCIIILFVASIFHSGFFNSYSFFSCIWLLLFIILFDIPFLKNYKTLFTPGIIVYAVFIAMSVTTALQYFNTVKEKDRIKFFAENIVRQRDEMMEYFFIGIADSISADPLLKTYFKNPVREERTFINDYIGTKYLRGQLNRYQADVYFFDDKGNGIYNKDTLNFAYYNLLAQNALPTENKYIFYRENAKEAHYYIAKIPLKDSTGFVILDLMLKKTLNDAVYPELLQPSWFKDAYNINYSYGIYANRELITQTNDFPFPIYLRNDSLRKNGNRILKRDGYSINIYKVDDVRSVAVIDTHKYWLEVLTLLSYMLGVLMIFSLFSFFIQLFFKYLLRGEDNQKLFQLTLRKRIHFGMLSVVMISFLIIGVITIIIFIDRYDDSNKTKLRSAMQVIERSVQQYLKEENIPLSAGAIHEATESRKFKNFISKLSNSQAIDINVYNYYGTLNATSQEDIYNKSILARIMMPDAYYKLSVMQRALLVENEKIGNLNYLSCYVPLRDTKGIAIGYINVPFFSSQKELNYQISNILVALINLYAFLFLISSLLAVVITNWLTKGLQMLIEKFKNVNLKENESLSWAHDDEVGLLIDEYNKMVKKVVQNAALMAQNERESAWREMAQQVAHEIKNPLTPMKLNIQYLQQALKNNQPNARQLTESVSESLIEHIDTLSRIASAFSDFAKMPEAAPENINLNELLAKTVELYNNNNAVSVQYKNHEESLVSYIDKSQLQRVFTNLLKNALEAIPEDRETNIIVSLQKENDNALVSIADNGIGIPDEIIHKIFSPYFTTKGSGSGLGLAMTKNIIEFWKGKIWFETVQGEGTIFYIRLPLIK